MPKMSIKSPKNVEDFIQAAGQQADTTFPWDDPKVRDDVMKLISLRLSEPYMLKLQWISEQTGKAQQKMLKDLVVPWIDEQVKKLSQEPHS
jgi:hypothetical protein